MKPTDVNKIEVAKMYKTNNSYELWLKDVKFTLIQLEVDGLAELFNTYKSKLTKQYDT